MEIVAKRLLELRTETGLGRTALASAMKLPHSYICDWEDGKKLPGAQNIVTICKFFGCTADYLLGLKPE